MPRGSSSKRLPTLVRLDPQVQRGLRLRAAVTGRSISDQVNDAVRRSLSEDGADITLARRRRSGPFRPYEEFLADMTRRGLL